jgi:HSP20 family molecular chaperone IbpA
MTLTRCPAAVSTVAAGSAVALAPCGSAVQSADTWCCGLLVAGRDGAATGWVNAHTMAQQSNAQLHVQLDLDLAKAFSPLMSMDLVENENGYQVMADLPGVDVENVDLSVEGNALVMKAERNHVHETKTDKVHRLERSYGSVKRRVVLPKNADLNNANTKFSNGVLTVTIPKLPEVQPKKLAINRE